jgi:hypothetical protein
MAANKSMKGLKRVKAPTGGTMRKGGLHRSTNTPQGQKIPASKLAAAKAGKYGPLAKKQANYASALAKMRPKGK